MSQHMPSDFYTPDEVDEQIDRRLQPQGLASADKELIDDLWMLFATPADTAEDRLSLARVKEKIQFDEFEIDLPTSSVASNTADYNNMTRIPARSSVHSFFSTRRSLFITLTTVLIMGVLLSSWLTITHLTSKNLKQGQNATSVVSNDPDHNALYTFYLTHVSAETTMGNKKGIWHIEKHRSRDNALIWQYVLNGEMNAMSHDITSNGIIYLTGVQTIYAIDAQNGKELWRNNLHDSIIKAIFKENGVYVDRGGTFTALSAQNGKEIWQVSYDQIMSYTHLPNNTGVLSFYYWVEDNRFYTIASVPGNSGLLALNALTGAFEWASPLPTAILSTTMSETVSHSGIVVDNGTTYITADADVYAFDEQTGELRRHVKTPDNQPFFDLSLQENILYGHSVKGNAFYALNGQDGQTVWSTPATIDISGPDGTILSIDSDDTTCDQSHRSSSVRPGPCTGKATLQVHKFSDGSTLWQQDLPCEEGFKICTVSNAYYANNKVYMIISSSQQSTEGDQKQQTEVQRQQLVVIDIQNRNIVSAFYLDTSVGLDTPSILNADDSYIYVQHNNANMSSLTVLNLSDKKVVWHKTFDNQLTSLVFAP